MRALLALLLATTVLAGCSDAPDDPSGPGTTMDGTAGTLTLPVWAVGDWWTYTLMDGVVATWVVTGQDGGDWIVGTDSEDLAFDHALDEISTLGKVSKAALDGSQGTDRVRYFDWPLEHGNTWTMTWDGEAFDAVSHVSAEEGLAHLVYSQDGVTRRNVVYDAAVGWFRSVEAVDANGTKEWGMALKSNGHGYRGDHVQWLLGDRLQEHVGTGSLLYESTFEVPEGATDIWYFLHGFCDPNGAEGDQGVYEVKVGPQADPTAPVFQKDLVCPDGFAEVGTWTPVAGTWYFDVQSIGGTVLADLIPRTLVTQTM